MKYLLLIFLFTAFIKAEATITEQYTFEISNSNGPITTNPNTCQNSKGAENGVYSESVTYEPGSNGCWKVICKGIGNIFCDFDCANEPIDPGPQLYSIADGYSILSYGMTQIKDSILVGNYSSNISNAYGNFLRSIQWNASNDKSTISIQINISKVQIPF